MISAAPFRDRVVHHALTRILSPIFEPTLIDDCYACRKGKGTHAAVRRYTTFARRYRYVLHADVRKYFPSIDHEILKELLARKVKDPHVLGLCNRIIDGSNPQETVQNWYPGDDLFDPGERRLGLPLGNQTSQFFANVYLSPLDHFANETLRSPAYLRYVDDFVLLHNETQWLSEAREQCRQFLHQLRLQLHPKKSAISRTVDGLRFLGYRSFPEYRLLPRANVVRFQRRLRRWRALLSAGQIERETAIRSLAGWLGHARQADTWRLRSQLFQRSAA